MDSAAAIVKETPKLYNGSNSRASKPFHWRLYGSEYEGLIGSEILKRSISQQVWVFTL